MASGIKRLQINTSERAVSTDINRLQQFAAAAAGEDWRALSNSFMGTDDFNAAGLYTQRTTQGTPAWAEVHGGLLVQPQVGAGQMNLIVTSGVCRMYDPDSPINTDDSQDKLIVDPGVQTIGALVLGTNSSGQIRIDVVEASRTTIVLETDNRDIFDPVSGLFTAQNVNKVLVDLLSYRVRAGTPGAGFPGAAAGWMPLCVASVPNGATSCDQVTFWDVRPLLSDRIHSPHNTSSFFGRSNDIDIVSDAVIFSPALFLAGKCDVVGADVVNNVGGTTRLGGIIQRGTPGVDNVSGSEGVNLVDAANLSATISATINYIYLLEPFGLPRWARYTDATSGSRLPRSPRGMLVATSIPPATTIDLTPAPSAAIPLPTSTGLVGSCSMGACIGAYNLGGSVLGAFITRGGKSINEAFGEGNAFAPTSESASTIVWALTPGTTHPAHARFIDVVMTFQIVVGATSTIGVTIVSTVLNNSAASIGVHPNVNEIYSVSNPAGSPAGVTFTVKARIPVDAIYPSQGIQVFGTFTSGGFTGGANHMYVTGFET